jgi:outer membrane murein-binding lipoprotein Lpp
MKRVLIAAVSLGLCVLNGKAGLEETLAKNAEELAKDEKELAQMQAQYDRDIAALDAMISAPHPTPAPRPGDPVPNAVHVQGGDYIDDAIAYAKVLTEFLKTHSLGRTQNEKAGNLLIIGTKACHDLGYDDAQEFWFRDFIEKLQEFGAID